MVEKVNSHRVANKNVQRTEIKKAQKSSNNETISMVDETKVQDSQNSSITTKQSEITKKFKESGYDEFYTMKFSDDGKFLLVTIKKTGALYPDPKAQTIVTDFIGKSGVLYDNNKELLEKRYNYTGEEGDSYNHAKLKAGDTVKIPINDVNIQDSPSGFFGRIISVS